EKVNKPIRNLPEVKLDPSSITMVEGFFRSSEKRLVIIRCYSHVGMKTIRSVLKVLLYCDYSFPQSRCLIRTSLGHCLRCYRAIHSGNQRAKTKAGNPGVIGPICSGSPLLFRRSTGHFP